MRKTDAWLNIYYLTDKTTRLTSAATGDLLDATCIFACFHQMTPCIKN